MITEIGPNKKMSAGRIFVLSYLVLFVLMAVYIQLHPEKVAKGSNAVLIATCVYISSALMIILMGRFFALSPKRVAFDDVSKEIQIKFLSGGTKNISVNDILSFSTMKIVSKDGTYPAIMTYLQSGKRILFSDLCLNNCEPFKTFLEQENVSYAGPEEYSYFSYYIKFW